ncbi:hypothetical protein Hanom_Chr03g00191841 [Helianthus anomalus]
MYVVYVNWVNTCVYSVCTFGVHMCMQIDVDANLRESVNHPKCGQFEGIIPDKLWKKYAVKIDVNKYAVKILCSHANTLHDGSNG